MSTISPSGLLRDGIEPSTFGFSDQRSNLLSYLILCILLLAIIYEGKGLEPLSLGHEPNEFPFTPPLFGE